VGIDARVQRPCCVHPRGSDLRHHHDLERVDAYSSRTAQDDRRGSSGREIRCFAWRASEAAFEAQYVYGRASRLLDVEFSLSRGDLWSRYGWEIMLALIVAGCGAAKLIREF